MKKIYFIIFCLIINLFFIKVYALALASENYALYNLNDNKIIYEKDSEEQVSIASLTKIMTAIITLDNIKDLDEKVKLLPEDFKGLVEENLVTAGFVSEEEVTYRDLLYGLMLPSGADAANSLARLIGKNQEEFVKMMNEKAKELNLKNTHFVNPTGLDADNHYSSVSDIATIFEYALKNDDFKKIIMTESYTTSDNKLTIQNNILKRSKNMGMDYILGGKTGTTDDAGLCLATIASKNEINYMLITLGAPYDKKRMHNFDDAKTIYEYFMNNYGYQTIVKKGQNILTLNTKYTKNDEYKVNVKEDIKEYLPNNYDKSKIKYDYDGKNTITSKMEKGTLLGKLTISYDSKKIKTLEIKLAEKQKFSVVKYLKDNILIALGILIGIILIFILLLKRKKTHNHLNQKLNML